MSYIPQLRNEVGEKRQTWNTWEELSVPIRTTPEYARAVVPPCFEPAADATGSVVISQYRKPCAGVHPGGGMEYECSMIYLDVTYKDITGWFALLMLVSGDMPVTLGREMLGEPKKTGETRIYHHGDGAYAYGARNGTRLVQIDAELGENLGPEETIGYGIELKGQPDPDFTSLQSNPYVVITSQLSKNSVTRTGPARLHLAGSPFDPVDEIPILDVGAARYVAGRADFKSHLWEQLPSREEYTPYIYSRRMYDFATVESPAYDWVEQAAESHPQSAGAESRVAAASS